MRTGLQDTFLRTGRSRRKNRTARPLCAEHLETRSLLAYVPELVQDVNTQPGSVRFDSVITWDNDLWILSYYNLTAGYQHIPAAGKPAAKLIGPGFTTTIHFNRQFGEQRYFYTAGVGLAAQRTRSFWVATPNAVGEFRAQQLFPPESNAQAPIEFVGDTDSVAFLEQSDARGNTTLWSLRYADRSWTKLMSYKVFLDDCANCVRASGASYRVGAYQDELAFAKTDAEANRRELWISDGTVSGTVRKTLSDGTDPPIGNDYTPGSTLFGSVLYHDGRDGQRAWSYDFSSGSLRRESGHSNLYSRPTLVNGRYVFARSDAEHGVELWVSDTFRLEDSRLLLDLEPGPADGVYAYGYSFEYAELPGRTNSGVFVTTPRGVYFSDGTLEGTHVVKNRRGNPLYARFATLSGSNRIVYSTRESRESGEYTLFHATDGTDSGNRLLREFIFSDASGSEGMYTTSDGLFFPADDGIHGMEFWVTNGSPESTSLARDLNRQTRSSEPAAFVSTQDRLYFLAATTPDPYLQQYWVLDKGQTTPVPVDGISNTADRIGRARAVNGNLLLNDQSAILVKKVVDHSWEPLGPGLVPDRGVPFYATKNGNRIVFSANDGESGYEPWVTDGTDAGTRMIANLGRLGLSSLPRAFVVLGENDVAFVARVNNRDLGIWVTENEMTSVRLVQTLPGLLYENSTRLFVMGDYLYYAPEYSSLSRAKNIKTDGNWYTPAAPLAGITFVSDRVGILPGESGEPASLVSVADDGNSFTVLKQLGYGQIGYVYPQQVVPFKNGHMFVVYIDGISYLWRTDGTPAGTYQLAEFGKQSFPLDLVPALGAVFIGSPDGFWRSNGTPDGTTRIAETPYVLGELREMPGFAIWQGDLYFRGYDDPSGIELMRIRRLPGDINFDGTVDISDFITLRSEFGKSKGEYAADLNLDGEVGIADFVILRNGFGRSAAEDDLATTMLTSPLASAEEPVGDMSPPDAQEAHRAAAAIAWQYEAEVFNGDTRKQFASK